MKIYSFKTKNFEIRVTAIDEIDPDFSFDETGETAAKVEAGDWQCFSVKAAVYFRGNEISADYLGNCIYADPVEFRDNVGLREKSRKDGRNYGSYFSDMVKQSIADARKEIEEIKSIKLRNN